MKRTTLFLLAAISACGAPQPSSTPPAAAIDPGHFAIVDVAVIPMTRDTILPSRTVLVRDGRIERIGRAEEVAVPASARRIDGTGRYLLPAFADMHVHVWRDAEMLMLLTAGVTLVRNMAGSPYQLELRRRIEAGEVLGPDIYTAGPIMYAEGPNAWTDADSAAAEVRRQAAAGYDFVKVYEYLRRDVYRAIVAAAGEVGMPVVGHVSSLVGMEEALQLGQRSIEHVYPFTWVVSRDTAVGVPHFTEVVDAWLNVDPERMAAWARRARDAGVWFVPTAGSLLHEFSPTPQMLRHRSRPELAWDDPWTRIARLEYLPRRYTAGRDEAYMGRVAAGDAVRDTMTRILHEAGVPVLAGSDHPPMGFSLMDEIAELARLGLGPWEALASATVRPARFLGLEAERGTIQEGLRAELVLLDGNPLADIENVRRVAGVLTRGQWLEATELRALLDRTRPSVYVGHVDRPGEGERLGTGILPRLDPEGRWVYFIDPDPAGAVVVTRAPSGPDQVGRMALTAPLFRRPVDGGPPEHVADGVAVHFVAGNAMGHGYDPSPDGEGVAYVTYVDGEEGFARPALALTPSDGSGSPRIAHVFGDTESRPTPRWAPDGSRVAVVDGDRVLLVEPGTGRIDTVAVLGDPSLDLRWSPDARAIALTARAGTDGRGVYVVGVDGSTRRLDPEEDPAPKQDVRWHPSGRFVAYVSRGDSWRIESVTLSGDPAPVFETQPEWYGAMLEWSADGEHLFLREFVDGNTSLFRIGLAGRRVPFAGHGRSPPDPSGQDGLIVWTETEEAESILRSLAKRNAAITDSGSSAVSSPSGLAGRVVVDTIHSPALEGNLLEDPADQEVAIYLPPGYDADGDRRYPVLYLLPPFDGSPTTWTRAWPALFGPRSGVEVMDSVMAAGAVPPFVVVMPNGRNRYHASYFANSPVTGAWEDFLARDVVGHVDRRYRTIAARQSRGLAGHSMGGSAAVQVAMNRPDQFGAVYAQSPCCLAGYGGTTAEEWDAVLRYPDADALEAGYRDGDFSAMALVAAGAAFLPAPGRPPFHVAPPFQAGPDGLRRVDEVWARWVAAAPIARLEAKEGALRRLNGLRIDHGSREGDFITNGIRRFADALADRGVPHQVEVYKGTHHDRIMERLGSRVLPFFVRALVTAPPIDPVWSYNHLPEDGNAFAVAAGDLDPADPEHELVVSQPFHGGRSGRVLYFADVADTVPDAVFPNPRGTAQPTLFGVALAVGDVNGDGVPDLAVGERTASARDTAEVGGHVVVYYGATGGGPPDPAPDLVLENPDAGPAAALDNFGDHVHIVGGAGLPAGGGRARILVGARTQDGGGGEDPTRGAVYAFDADGTLLWHVQGASAEYLGKWVETGDLDGDGALDLVVGGARPTNQDAHPLGGIARVWLLGDGTLEDPGDRFDLPHPEAALGTGENHNFGYRVVAGDATGDGLLDLIVSDPYYGRTVGAAYLYEGPLRRDDRPEWVFRGNPALTRVPLLGRGIDFGDADGDGTDDFVVGAPAWGVGHDQARVYLFRGGPIAELPGSGSDPRVAIAPDADAEYRPPGTGNLGEYAVIAPIRQSPGRPEDVVSTILHSRQRETIGAYLYPGWRP